MTKAANEVPVAYTSCTTHDAASLSCRVVEFLSKCQIHERKQTFSIYIRCITCIEMFYLVAAHLYSGNFVPHAPYQTNHRSNLLDLPSPPSLKEVFQWVWIPFLLKSWLERHVRQSSWLRKEAKKVVRCAVGHKERRLMQKDRPQDQLRVTQNENEMMWAKPIPVWRKTVAFFSFCTIQSLFFGLKWTELGDIFGICENRNCFFCIFFVFFRVLFFWKKKKMHVGCQENSSCRDHNQNICVFFLSLLTFSFTVALHLPISRLQREYAFQKVVNTRQITFYL